MSDDPAAVAPALRATEHVPSQCASVCLGEPCRAVGVSDCLSTNALRNSFHWRKNVCHCRLRVMETSDETSRLQTGGMMEDEEVAVLDGMDALDVGVHIAGCHGTGAEVRDPAPVGRTKEQVEGSARSSGTSTFVNANWSGAWVPRHTNPCRQGRKSPWQRLHLRQFQLKPKSCKKGQRRARHWPRSSASS